MELAVLPPERILLAVAEDAREGVFLAYEARARISVYAVGLAAEESLSRRA